MVCLSMGFHIQNKKVRFNMWIQKLRESTGEVISDKIVFNSSSPVNFKVFLRILLLPKCPKDFHAEERQELLKISIQLLCNQNFIQNPQVTLQKTDWYFPYI